MKCQTPSVVLQQILVSVLHKAQQHVARKSSIPTSALSARSSSNQHR